MRLAARGEEHGSARDDYRQRDSNPHGSYLPRDFKSLASAISPCRHHWKSNDSRVEHAESAIVERVGQQIQVNACTRIALIFGFGWSELRERQHGYGMLRLVIVFLGLSEFHITALDRPREFAGKASPPRAVSRIDDVATPVRRPVGWSWADFQSPAVPPVAVMRNHSPGARPARRAEAQRT